MYEVEVARVKRGFVSSAYVRLLFEYMEKQGVDAAVFFGEAPPELVDRGLQRCPMERWCKLLQQASDRLNDPLLGLRLGATITPAHLGVMGYMLASCPQIGIAMVRMVEYERLIYDSNPLRITTRGSDLVLEWGLEYGRCGPLADECGIASLIQFARAIASKPIVITTVCFANQVPTDPQPYIDFFGCQVVFDQSVTSISAPLWQLAVPLRQPDIILVRLLEQQADAMLKDLPQANEFEQAVRRCITRLIRDGEPDLEQVAQKMSVSPRTLRRRLDESGINFRALLENIRRNLAEIYLLDPRLSLSEIAQLLGYSEQSAFTRAFRRWTGYAPYQYQQKLLRGAGYLK